MVKSVEILSVICRKRLKSVVLYRVCWSSQALSVTFNKTKFVSCNPTRGFASDLDTAQRMLLQNFNKPTETVVFQEPRFFGGLNHSQKDKSRLKINYAAEELHLRKK
ncbi:hypothetical protein NQ318_023416 [Aromia moschata]|uniref:Uncharacterized protein n=1 Tax=Aromia moschata TaxID=1265417 RepID=A0AAV8YUS5_9CUCU|nr:hypothetical protein NQ318_023416 [Aromia moschata]